MTERFVIAHQKKPAGLKVGGKDVTLEALYAALKKIDPNYSDSKFQQLLKLLSGE